MDKFAVSDDAQGEGLGRAMWDVMRGDNPALFWRSRRGNAINEFYFANAEGARKEMEWTVFWYGLDDWPSIQFAVHQAVAKPATLLTDPA
jgi:acetylglutamate kinase